MATCLGESPALGSSVRMMPRTLRLLPQKVYRDVEVELDGGEVMEQDVVGVVQDRVVGLDAQVLVLVLGVWERLGRHEFVLGILHVDGGLDRAVGHGPETLVEVLQNLVEVAVVL